MRRGHSTTSSSPFCQSTVAIGTFYQLADLGTGPINAQQGVFIAKFGR